MAVPCISLTRELNYGDFCRLHYNIAKAHGASLRDNFPSIPLAQTFVRYGGYKSGELTAAHFPLWRGDKAWGMFDIALLSGSFTMEYLHGVVLRCNRKTKRRLWSVALTISYDLTSRHAMQYYCIFLHHTLSILNPTNGAEGEDKVILQRMLRFPE